MKVTQKKKRIEFYRKAVVYYSVFEKRHTVLMKEEERFPSSCWVLSWKVKVLLWGRWENRLKVFLISIIRGIWDKKRGYFHTVPCLALNIVQPRIFTDPFQLLLFEQREISNQLHHLWWKWLWKNYVNINKEKVILSETIPISLMLGKWVI